MAAQFRLIPETGKRYADKLALQGLGNSPAHRGLAGPRRPGKAEDRALAHLDKEFFIQHLPHGFAQLIEVDRFAEIVGRAFLQGLDRGGDGGKARHHDDGNLRRPPVDLLEKFNAVHPLHLQIGDYQIDFFLGQNRQSLKPVVGAVAEEAIFRQDMGHVGAGYFLIVDDQDSLPGLAAQGLGRQEFKNPLLDLGQAAMAGIEEGLSPGQIEGARRRHIPGQGEHQFDVVETNRIFGNCRIGFFEFLKLFDDRFKDLGGEGRPIDLAAKFGQG